MPTTGDHVLIALIAVLYPLYFAYSWLRRTRPQMEKNEVRARRQTYRETLAELWLLALAVLAWWLWSSRPLEMLGLAAPSGLAFWIGLTVVAMVGIFLGMQVASARRSPEIRAQVRKQLQKEFGTGAAFMIPRGRHERRYWIALSLTAGMCEELLYRAFLMWYVMSWLPGIAAVPISAVVFGIPHFYLGWGGMVKATITGGVLAAIYLITGSLWIPMALHAVIDLGSGLTGSAGLEGDPMHEEST